MPAKAFLIALLLALTAAPAWAGDKANDKANKADDDDDDDDDAQVKPHPECVLVPVDLAFLPRYSLDALYKPCARNLLGLTLLANQAGELTGLELAVGGNAVDYDAKGVQIAGFSSVAGEDLYGLQIGGLMSVAGRAAHGIQLGGLMSVAGRDLWGIQVGGLLTAAGKTGHGVQIGGLISATGKHFSGIQVGGLISATGKRFSGIQVGGLISATGKSFSGIQIGGLFSAAGKRMTGLQLAGGMNATTDGVGLQLAGGANRAYGHFGGAQIAIVNLGCDVTGMQIGVVNIAGRVHGLQLGLVNVADDADAPIGLVSYMRRGERAVEVWGGEAVPLAAGVRLGTRRVYSLLGFGGDPARHDRPWGPVAGVGVKGDVVGDQVAVAFDALAYNLFFSGVDDQALLAQARLRALIDVTPRLSLTVGASWNVFVSDDLDGAALPLGGDSVELHGSTFVRQWPGVSAGVAMQF